MSLVVGERETEGIVILDLAGRLVAGQEVADLRRKLEHLQRHKKNRLILNLKDVDYIDSTGLGTLVVAHSAAEDEGGAVKLLNVSKRGAHLLVLTKLSTVFTLFDDEKAAINSFFPDREIRHFDVLDFVKETNASKAQDGAGAQEDAETKKQQ